jgi:RHS repeat-associated protein
MFARIKLYPKRISTFLGLFSHNWSANTIRVSTLGFPASFVTIMTVTLFTCFSQSFSGQPGYVGQLPSDASSSMSPGSGSLYTGSYSNSFPLLSMGSVGGLSIDIALSYNSSVLSTILEDNRDRQSSWVGLGFSFGMATIACDNNGTVDIGDDRYLYFGPEGQFELRWDFSYYHPDNGLNWLCYQTTSFSSKLGRNIVTGWTIEKEDGSFCKFGDFAAISSSGQPTLRSATRYMLAWGNSVGVGFTNQDQLVPIQWDISQTITSDGRKWLKFTHTQDSVYLQVKDTSSGATTNSVHAYTRWVYPKGIESSNGYSVEFILGDRIDFQDFKPPCELEFYSTKRLDAVQMKHTSTGTLLYKTILKYDYLDNVAGPVHCKLLLKSIARINGALTDTLPETGFSYFLNTTDPNRGALQSISHPTGSVSKMTYRTIDSVNNFAVLNYSDTNYLNTKWDDGRRAFSSHAWSRNCYIGREKLFDGHIIYEVGAWRGFWDFQILPDIENVSGNGDLENQDFEVAASDDWVVFLKRDLHKFIVLRDAGGGWIRDTITPSWTRTSGAPYVQIYAGKDAFIACVLDVPNAARPDSMLFLSAYFYHRNTKNSGWSEHTIATRTDGKGFGGVQLGSNTFGMSLYNIDPGGTNFRQVLYYGSFDVENDTLVTVYDNENNNWFTSLKWSVNRNSLAYIGNGMSGLKIVRFDGATMSNSTYAHAPNSILPISGGFVFNEIRLVRRGNQDITVQDVFTATEKTSGWDLSLWNAFGDTTLFDSSGIHFHSYTNLRLYSSFGNTFAVDWYQSGWPGSDDSARVEVGIWNGNKFNRSVVVATPNYISNVKLSDENCVVYDQQNKVWASRLLANNLWETPRLIVSGIVKDLAGVNWGTSILDCSRDIVTVVGAQASDTAIKRRCIYRWNGNAWDSLNIKPLTANNFYEFSPGLLGPWSSNAVLPVVYKDRVTLISGYVSRAAFQYFNGSWVGQAKFPVLDKIESYRFSADPLPTTVKFGYDGGILDEGLSGGRFCKTTTSTPYFSNSSPEGYSVNYYYNDVDDDSSFDGNRIRTQLKKAVPDLKSSFNFGLPYGGYLLDGSPFISFDSSATDPAGTCFDSLKQNYSVRRYRRWSGGQDRLTTLVVKSHTRQDKIPNDVNISYDYLNRAVRTEQIDATGIRHVDSTEYWNLNHLYNKPRWRVSYLDSANIKQYLSRSYAEWNYFSNNKLIRTMVWPNASTDIISDTLDWYQTVSFVNADTGGLPPKIDTVFYGCDSTADSAICQYTLRLKSRQAGEFAKMWIKFHEIGSYILYDSLVSTADTTRCRGSALFQKDSVILLKPMDTLLFILNNSDSTYCLGSGTVGSKGWAAVDLNLTYFRKTTGNEIYTFLWSSDIADKGVDTFGNMYCWLSNGLDTNSAKFSPDGTYQVAQIQNGHFKDCLLFDAEFDFSSTGLGYDQWRIWNPGYGRITDSFAFSGKRSLRITDDPSSGADNFLWRKIAPGTLTRNKYLLSFWHLDFGGAGLKVLSFTNSVQTTVLSKSYSISPSWVRVMEVMDLSQFRNADSILVGVGLLNGGGPMIIDDIRFHPVDAMVNTSTIDPVTGLTITQSDNDNIPVRFNYDDFFRTTSTRNHVGLIGQLLDSTEYYFSAMDPANNGSYNPSKPNYVKVTKYKDNTIAPTAIDYFDGSGRLLERRSRLVYRDTLKTMVSGFQTFNARGQTVKSYKPFVDYIGQTGLLDYSDSAAMVSEVNSFYNGNYGQIDCGGYPFSENLYEQNIKSRLIKAAAAGPVFRMGSGKEYSFFINTNISGSDTVSVSGTLDPDSIRQVAQNQRKARQTRSVSYYRRTGGVPDSIRLVTTEIPMLQRTVVAIDTGQGSAAITLRVAYMNDRGLIDSTWKVDYGIVRTKYDEKGNIRFVQNDKRKSEGSFVYYKYDGLGRRIEEGIMGNGSLYFNDSCTRIKTFPSSQHTPVPSYRWFYDYYVSGSDTLRAPGKLVRVDNNTGGYYRKFYFDPTGYSDSVLVQLNAARPAKWIKHSYNRDGSIAKLTVLPKYNSSNGIRSFLYKYDATGRLEGISNGAAVGQRRNDYVRYSYNPDGSIRRSLYGFDSCASCSPGRYDTIQQIDYVYNTAGLLDGINDPNAVSSSLTGIGAVNDHFATALKYYDATAPNYYNGRVRQVKSANSKSGGVSTHDFQYIYNDLGWLATADHDATDGGDQYDEQYHYNALGQRDTLKRGPSGSQVVTAYSYNTGTPGSSRLRSITGMGSYKMWYDTLGNLVRDTSRQLYSMLYDYRNLMVSTHMATTISGGQPSELQCVYDETGNRIEKYFKFQYWTDCGPPNEEFNMASPGGGELQNEGMLLEEDISEPDSGATSQAASGGDQCPAWKSTSTYYLYDGGVLLATFDNKDSVVDLFVNGPAGRIASYSKNNNAYLYYYLNDHLGSTRVLMQGVPGSYQVAQYYTFYPFGQELEGWGSAATPFKFTGKERDVHSSFAFDYFGARYYDPRIGQFSSVDAAGQFASGFVYVGNNPISLTDPDGNVAPLVVGLLQIAGGALFAYGTINYGSELARLDARPSGGDRGTSWLLKFWLPTGLSLLTMMGVPTGIPNPYQGTDLGTELVTSFAIGAANSALHQSVTSAVINEGHVSVDMGSVFSSGVMSAGMSGLNWKEEKGFRQAKQQAKWREELKKTQAEYYASLGITPATGIGSIALNSNLPFQAGMGIGSIDFAVEGTNFLLPEDFEIPTLGDYVSTNYPGLASIGGYQAGYNTGYWSAGAYTVARGGPSVSSFLFGKAGKYSSYQGWLNGRIQFLGIGEKVRLGWSYKKGFGDTFRLGGRWVESLTGRAHINLWPPSLWFK